jgi:glycosyltransferase involved in cell wall biosynthesis
MKIVVLTPVKNEEWILDAFLKTTSLFADHILLADQNSTDRTVEIANSYEKVVVIKNDGKSYNEASRQQLLIDAARKLFGSDNMLIAIDADEIIAFDGIGAAEWKQMRNLEKGTVLYFEKPTFFDGLENVIRYEKDGGWPLGFIDDGSVHKPTIIHSVRIPFHENSPKFFSKEIKFLHCNLLSLSRQRAKIRYYCLIEAISKSKPWHHRITYYNKDYDYQNEGDGLTAANPLWTQGWLDRGIVFVAPKVQKYYWYDKEFLRLLETNYKVKLWFDDIWDINLNEAKDYFKISNTKAKQPPRLVSFLRDGMYHFVQAVFAVKNLLKSNRVKST